MKGWCQKALGLAGAPPLLDVGDAAEAQRHNVDAAALLLDVGDAAEAPPLLDVDAARMGWNRCIVRFPGQLDHRVVFDKFSHQSSKQRGYINCQHDDHDGCLRYRFCEQWPSREAFCASLMAWATSGQDCRSRTQHIDAEPSVAWVATITAAMELEDYCDFGS